MFQKGPAGQQDSGRFITFISGKSSPSDVPSGYESSDNTGHVSISNTSHLPNPHSHLSNPHSHLPNSYNGSMGHYPVTETEEGLRVSQGEDALSASSGETGTDSGRGGSEDEGHSNRGSSIDNGEQILILNQKFNKFQKFQYRNQYHVHHFIKSLSIVFNIFLYDK